MKFSRGFTLLEVLVALAVITLFMVCIAGMATGGVRTAQRAERITAAGNLAAETLAQIILDPTRVEPVTAAGRTIARKNGWTLTVNLRPNPDPAAMTWIHVAVAGGDLSRPIVLDRLIPGDMP